MRMPIVAALALLGSLGAPLWAQDAKKIDDAVRKANEQLAKGRSEDARKTLEKLRDQLPGSADAHAAFGELLIRMGELEAAGAAFDQGVPATRSAAAEEQAKALAHLANFELRTKAGKDALAEVTVRVVHDGIESLGQAASTDTIEATLKAYLSAVAAAREARAAA